MGNPPVHTPLKLPLAASTLKSDNRTMSRTYRTNRRTYQRVPDSRTPRTPGARTYQAYRDGTVLFDEPLERARVKRGVSKARRRGNRRVVEAELRSVANG